MTVTSFGSFVRRLRIDNDEILRDMAEKIGVSSAFLSAVENGKKNIPYKWLDKISKLYRLDKKKKQELKKAIEISKDKIVINVKGQPDENKEIAMIFARSFGNLDDKTMAKIRKILM